MWNVDTLVWANLAIHIQCISWRRIMSDLFIHENTTPYIGMQAAIHLLYNKQCGGGGGNDGHLLTTPIAPERWGDHVKVMWHMHGYQRVGGLRSVF